MFGKKIDERIFSLKNEEQFEKLSLEIFRVQAEHNKPYKEFIEKLKINVSEIKSLKQIPFLPIEFFKTHRVITGEFIPETVFKSSGTTGNNTSNHFIKHLSLYEKCFINTFKLFFGQPEDFTFLALLPSYLERKNSSLIYMTKKLIELSNDNRSNFFSTPSTDLIENLKQLRREKKKALFIGVTFALIDFPNKIPTKLSQTIIMETGGMKGRKKEMIREEVHALLKNKFGVNTIHSEYGMTELLSQAYSKGDGNFNTPPWMKIFIREPNDPLELLSPIQSGAINIIDLANIHSCSFIATDDLGRINKDGSFSVSGRLENSDIRGCNLPIN